MKPLAVPPLTIQIYPYLGTELPPFTFKFNALLSVITTPCDHLSILVKFHFSSPSTTSHLQILTRTLTPLLVTSFERNLLSPENLSPPQSLSPLFPTKSHTHKESHTQTQHAACTGRPGPLAHVGRRERGSISTTCFEARIIAFSFAPRDEE